MPQNLHVWEMFIKPEELRYSFERYGLQQMDIKGIKPGNQIRFIISAHQYTTGKMSAVEFAKRISPVEGPDMAGFYMGYAIKKLNPDRRHYSAAKTPQPN